MRVQKSSCPVLKHLSTMTWMVECVYVPVSSCVPSVLVTLRNLNISAELEKCNKTLWDHVSLVCSWKLQTDLFYVAYFFYQLGQFPTQKLLKSTATSKSAVTFEKLISLEVPDRS